MALFDFDTLTGKEIALIEELSGQSIATIGNADKPMAKGLYALALVIRRRAEGQALTYNAVMDMTLQDVTALIGFDEDEPDEDSEEGKDERSEKSARKSKPAS